MTIEELAKLSDEELRVRCAELCGVQTRYFKFWYQHEEGNDRLTGIRTLEEAEEERKGLDGEPVEEYTALELIPNYPADLNAMHEAIAALTDEELTKVACLLRRMSANDPDDPEATLWDYHGWPGLLKASPRQIAIAFIAVKQQPVEVKGGGE